MREPRHVFPPRDEAKRLPEVPLPAAPHLREAVKNAVYSLMQLPAVGPIVRAAAAEQSFFPNFRVDQLTFYAIQQLVKRDSCCIDVGAHIGDVTQMLLNRAPEGTHFAFEPLSECQKKLRKRFEKALNVRILPIAVSNSSGPCDFTAVTQFPGYSGLAHRSFKGSSATIEHRTVAAGRLDDLIPQDTKIDFIKLDIEGAELAALQGAKRLIAQSKPTLLLEFQRTAAPYFETLPNEMLAFLTAAGYQVWSLEQWCHNQSPLKLATLWDLFDKDPNLYLLCRPKERP
jgi:FkbM family methyltransferase